MIPSGETFGETVVDDPGHAAALNRTDARDIIAGSAQR
jgi:hypothetical protein